MGSGVEAFPNNTGVAGQMITSDDKPVFCESEAILFQGSQSAEIRQESGILRTMFPPEWRPSFFFGERTIVPSSVFF